MQHLDIFSKKLLVQGEALDYALIAGVESPQLYPLAGGVSADRTRETRQMLVCERPNRTWHGTNVRGPRVTEECPSCHVRGENSWLVLLDDKTSPAPAALKLELIIQSEEGDLNLVQVFKHGTTYNNCFRCQSVCSYDLNWEIWGLHSSSINQASAWNESLSLFSSSD